MSIDSMISNQLVGVSTIQPQVLIQENLNIFTKIRLITIFFNYCDTGGPV